MALSSLLGSAGELAGGLTGAVGGLAGGAGVSAPLTYTGLQSEYGDFAYPQAQILFNQTPLDTASADLIVNDIRVELTAGFEASVASFRIYNVYDASTGSFRFDAVKSQVLLGAALEIQLGYLNKLKTVFVGFVAGVSFGYEAHDLPYIEVTGMDVKGIMMAGTYANQLTANNYGDAVSEILRRTGYEQLKQGGGILNIQVTPTPDKQGAGTAGGAAGGLTGGLTGAAGGLGGAAGGGAGKASAYTVEMVSESDYEFVVKAAKKFNYEFFTDRGTVYFRKAKSVTAPLMTLGVGSGLVTFHVEYSITGIVGSIEARAMNAGDGKLISAKGTFQNSMSTAARAKGLVSTGKKVLIDPTISSQSDADARVESLMEQMSYRLGSLEGDCVGIPDLVPGRFITLSGLGAPVDNSFYLTTVVHEFRDDTGYQTHITGKADRVSAGGAGTLGAAAGGLTGGALGGAAGAAGGLIGL